MTAKRKKTVFHYLSGASMRGINLRAGTDLPDAKRNTFLVVGAIAGVAWLVVLIWF